MDRTRDGDSALTQPTFITEDAARCAVAEVNADEEPCAGNPQARFRGGCAFSLLPSGLWGTTRLLDMNRMDRRRG